MALSVATNTGALMAQAAASSVNKEMEVSMERLSTGKRINGAADDAAGVAIASRLSSEIRGTNQAIKNAMDAQAMIDTAEGAHEEIEVILQRMRELAVQAANDTNNSGDRSNLQAEATQLSTEIDRIAETTTWAGQNLLDASGGAGQNGAFEFQLGSRSSTYDELTISIGSMTSATLGVTANNTSAGGAVLTEVGTDTLQVTGQIKAGDVFSYTINGEAGDYTVLTGDVSTVNSSSQAAVAAKIATDIAAMASPGLTAAAAGNAVTLNQDIVTYSGATVTSAGTTSTSVASNAITIDMSGAFGNGSTALDFSVNGVSVAFVAGEFSAGTEYSGNQAGLISILEDKIAALNAANSLRGLTLTVAASGSTGVTITSTPTDGHSNATTAASFIENAAANPAAGSSTINLDTATNAQTAIGLIDTAIQNLNSQRAGLGSYSNRLDSTVSNLTNISANLQAGRGRIEDADFAAETTNLARTQILQQASTAMLAQANASKQNVLSLLQG